MTGMSSGQPNLLMLLGGHSTTSEPDLFPWTLQGGETVTPGAAGGPPGIPL